MLEKLLEEFVKDNLPHLYSKEYEVNSMLSVSKFHINRLILNFITTPVIYSPLTFHPTVKIGGIIFDEELNKLRHIEQRDIVRVNFEMGKYRTYIALPPNPENDFYIDILNTHLETLKEEIYV
jgi:hypothetical protein